MTNLTKLEIEVMRMLLDGDDEVLSALRKQLAKCKVKSRELTGVGFFTTFIPAQSDDVLSRVKSFKIGDVFAKIEGTKHGAGFLLYVENGKIYMLEGYTFDDPWPSEIGEFKLCYINDVRNLTEIKKNWLS
jgi:hypothetical protein